MTGARQLQIKGRENMTVEECVRFVDDTKPNAFPEDVKVIWVGQIEGRIANEIMLLAPAELKRFHFTSMLEDGQKELLVDAPYDDIYTAYLTAKVDSKNGEFNKLSTAAQSFNRIWNEFSAWFAGMYNPAAGYYGEIGSEYAGDSHAEEGEEEFGIVE